MVPTPSLAREGRVTQVIDGDTNTVSHKGNTVKIRLYGIGTPERSQWYGQNATGIHTVKAELKTRIKTLGDIGVMIAKKSGKLGKCLL